MTLSFLQTEWGYLTGAFVTLFFIVDPFAVVPVYLALSERFTPHDQKVIRRKATLIALALLVAFAVTGMTFFELFGITLPAFRIAGGILLLVMGVQQLTVSGGEKVSSEEESEGLSKDDISVFPLATPLLAGPGAISTVILYATGAGSALRLVELTLAIVACLAATYVILRASPYLYRVMGKTGLNLFSRLMGIVLTAVGVQFVIAGVIEAAKGFKG